MRNVLIRRKEINGDDRINRWQLCPAVGWLQSLVTYLVVLPTLWEAIVFEGTADTFLCFAVMWQSFIQFLSCTAVKRQEGSHSRTILVISAIRGILALSVGVLFCTSHYDDPFRLAYIVLSLFFSLRVSSPYSIELLREPLLVTSFGLSLLFALGVVRHEWWYCELKGDPCAAFAATHIVVSCALVVLLLILLGGKERPLWAKTLRVGCGLLLMSIAVNFTVSDLSLHPALHITSVDSSVGLLSTIILLIAPYLNVLCARNPSSKAIASSSRSVIVLVVSAVLLLLLLTPTVIQFYNAPRFESSASTRTEGEFTLREELVTLLLTAEDPTFFFHSGIDFVRLRDAITELVQSGHYGRGGSTLSMQLGKVLYLEYDKTIIRKLKQVILGLLIEFSYPKETILRKYLEVVPFAPGVVGIENASRRFFATPMLHLNREQLLRLVIAIYDPRINLYGEGSYKGDVSIRARTIETRERLFSRIITEQFLKYNLAVSGVRQERQKN